ncbi:hypoxanthine phosphoribosyltransferase [Heyndrickxia sporothermodurans]|nr:hypoxanthine phosphoribosyltransferase [Heyndrickxia sporothermodurans]MED3653792.1 hypoxanthine phosphoribosyltransferase [Heyndrickxia sporothermodurans]
MLVFEKKLADFVKRNNLLKYGDSLLVGVSGGPDSIALLHYLHRKKTKYHLSIMAAHVDHMLRGNESYNDLKFVQSLCKQWDIPCETVRINIQEKMVHEQKGFEETARIYRYQFFADIMKRHHHHKLLLGHHGDDQIETILMRLTRGSTGKGRAGIPLTRPFANGQIVRPLLCLTKQEIEEYCHFYGLQPRRDPSNQDQDYTRNRYRLNILPFLKRENQHVHEHFQRFSEEITEDEDYLQELTLLKMNKLWNKNENEITIEIPLFNAMPLPLQRRGIQLILNYLYKENLSNTTTHHTDAIRDLLADQKPSGQLDLPLGLKVIRSYQKCIFSFKQERQTHTYELKLFKDNEKNLPNGYFMKLTEGKVYELQDDEIYLQLDEAQLPLIIRNKRIGDRMRVKGLNGTKKVKDIFIDEKIPKDKREDWPIVTDNKGKILWIPNLKKSSFCFLPNPEQSCYILQYSKQTTPRGQAFQMKQDIEKILISEEEIQKKTKELAEELTIEYKDRFPLAIGVLKGATLFMSDLLKQVDTYLEMDFMDVSSYGKSMVSSGEVKILKDLDTSVEGRDILIIEDIIDSGLTLSYLVELFRYRKAKSIKIVTLLDKPSGRKANIEADYVGFEVPDAFVVGYGLDYAERYRNLPYIGVLKPSVYNKDE